MDLECFSPRMSQASFDLWNIARDDGTLRGLAIALALNTNYQVDGLYWYVIEIQEAVPVELFTGLDKSLSGLYMPARIDAMSSRSRKARKHTVLARSLDARC